MKGEKRYFETWSGYKIPYTPSCEISEDKALTLKSYYVGIYKGDMLIAFEKILDSKREWVDQYEYWDRSKKIKKRILTKADSSVSIQTFDKKGKIIL